MPTPGVCQFCKVTDDQVDGDKLSWHDAERSCCSRYACVKKHHAAKKASAARANGRKQSSRFKGWGFGAICEELIKEERARKRKKGRAA